MARKRGELFESLITSVARTPWWFGLLLALISHAVLHYFAKQAPHIRATSPGAIAETVQRTFITTICMVMQYVLPMLFMMGASLSAWRKIRALTLFHAAKKSPDDSRLTGFTWQEFEVLVGEAFRQKGYNVAMRGGDGPDGGIDLIARSGSDKYLIQCKHWRTTSVGVATVRELFGVMVAENATGAFVVASGRFTSEAAKFAQGRPIKLVDAVTLIKGAKPKISPTSTPPECPRCGAPMRLRQARKGRDAGASFLGCSKYPNCKGTLQL